MKTLKLLVAFDGTDFRGWQRQPGLRTVQGTLEERLRELLEDDDVSLVAAGRTDAGVHARGQVASFQAETVLPGHALAPLLNTRLPKDVRVRATAEAPHDFHARHSARARRYAYQLLRSEDVLRGRFAWCPRRPFDPERLTCATQVLEGEHDFTAFQSSGSTPVPPVCRVIRASWSATRDGARLDIIADHFLYRMVRNIVGAALRLATVTDCAMAMREVLVSRDRNRPGGRAPAHGLCLEEVFYQDGQP